MTSHHTLMYYVILVALAAKCQIVYGMSSRYSYEHAELNRRGLVFF